MDPPHPLSSYWCHFFGNLNLSFSHCSTIIGHPWGHHNIGSYVYTHQGLYCLLCTYYVALWKKGDFFRKKEGDMYPCTYHSNFLKRQLHFYKEPLSFCDLKKYFFFSMRLGDESNHKTSKKITSIFLSVPEESVMCSHVNPLLELYNTSRFETVISHESR